MDHGRSRVSCFAIQDLVLILLQQVAKSFVILQKMSKLDFYYRL